MGAHDAALRAFEDAVRINPRLDRAWYGMGLTLRAIGRREDALKSFQQAAELQPMNGFSWYELGVEHHALGHHETFEAVLSRLGVLTPSSPTSSPITPAAIDQRQSPSPPRW